MLGLGEQGADTLFPFPGEDGGSSELTTIALGMSLAPRPGSCRQTHYLFCCFIGLLGLENWSSESWERQHLVGTGVIFTKCPQAQGFITGRVNIGNCVSGMVSERGVELIESRLPK